MANIDIRDAIKKSNLKHWEVADLLGISETAFCRRLRKELSEQEKKNVLDILSKNKKKKNNKKGEY